MIRFYHAPWSRASGILWLLEELGQPYEIELVDIRAPGGVPESYRAIQPNKKVPAIVHEGTVVTERAAICLYLTERFPEAGLAPAIGDTEPSCVSVMARLLRFGVRSGSRRPGAGLGICTQQFLLRRL